MKKLLSIFALTIVAACSPPQDRPANAPDSSSASSRSSMSSAPSEIELLSGKHTVVIQTSMGDMTIEVDADAAPKTATNFVKLAENGYYDDMIFHRVIPEFMIQGGDPTGSGRGGESIYGHPFEDEINAENYDLHEAKLSEVAADVPPHMADMTLKQYYEAQGYSYDDSLESLPLDYGYVAMANAGPNTNGSQFFIIQNEDGVDQLAGRHTVFGRVTEGLDVIDAIANVERNAQDKPLEDVTFSIEVQE